MDVDIFNFDPVRTSTPSAQTDPPSQAVLIDTVAETEAPTHAVCLAKDEASRSLLDIAKEQAGGLSGKLVHHSILILGERGNMHVPGRNMR